MLPDYSGRELCRKLRYARIATPILFLTALSTTEEKIEGLREGGDGYLTKPFDFEELLAHIEALVRRSPSAEASAERETSLRVGDLCLDLESHTVTQDGRLVELTPREFQLLQILMRSKGKVVSRTRMLSAIWGCDYDPLTNVVDVHIQRLRTRLDWTAESGMIKTVRGYGYKLIDA